jgi:peroxiredoxin
VTGAVLALLASAVLAPELRLQHWLNGPPLEMAGLRGRVVVLRWWTDRCSLCESAAPTLRALHERHAGQGLVVLGIYHPKPQGASLADARRRAEAGAARLGFEFPIAIDRDWRALDRWWLHGRERAATSVTFVVDRRGVIRHVHPGGAYDRESVSELERTVAELLAEE